MSRRPRASTTPSRAPARDERRPRPSRERRRSPARETRARRGVGEGNITPLRARRGLSTPTKVIVVVGLIASVLTYGASWVLRSSWFRVHTVVVTGNQRETSADVTMVAGLGANPTMVSLSASEIESRLLVFPWIASSVVTLKWPSTVEIVVHESRAVAVAYGPHHRLDLISATGRVLSPAAATANLPTLVTPAGQVWSSAGLDQHASEVAADLPPAFASQVRQIIVDAHGNVTLQLTTPLSFFLGQPDDPQVSLTTKFIAVASVIAHATMAPGDVVDVSSGRALAVTGPTP